MQASPAQLFARMKFSVGIASVRHIIRVTSAAKLGSECLLTLRSMSENGEVSILTVDGTGLVSEVGHFSQK